VSAQPLARIWWSGPFCGLGNRLFALAAAKACAGGRAIHFPWSNDPSCTGDYADIFEPTPGLVLQPVSLPGDIMIETGWEPLGIYERFKEALKLDLSLADFCADLVAELRSLPFRADLTAAARAWRASAGAASLIGVHIRRTDRTEHHRQQFRAFLRGEQGLNRELPIYLNAVYGLCPNSVIWAHENMTLTRALRRYKSASGAISYTVFSDDIGETRKFQKAAAFGGVGRERCVSGTSAPRSPQAAHGFRNTALKDAALDLLRLCECDAIAQSNRASTFSLAASIIGGKPIITAKTRYPFWRVIEEKISASPSDVRLPRRAA
jgi:hypothetical protein